MAVFYLCIYLFLLCGCYTLKGPDMKFIKSIFLALHYHAFWSWYDHAGRKGWTPLSKTVFRF